MSGSAPYPLVACFMFVNFLLIFSSLLVVHYRDGLVCHCLRFGVVVARWAACCSLRACWDLAWPAAQCRRLSPIRCITYSNASRCVLLCACTMFGKSSIVCTEIVVCVHSISLATAQDHNLMTYTKGQASASGVGCSSTFFMGCALGPSIDNDSEVVLGASVIQ